MPRGVVAVELPVDDHSLVGRHAPEHVEERRRHPAIRLGPPLGVGRDGTEQRRVLAAVRLQERRVERPARLERVGRDVPEDAGRDVRHVLQAHPRQVDARRLLHAVHHCVTEPLLVHEVPVDRALVDAGPFGHGADGQRAPVPDGRTPEHVRARLDDALARLRRPPPPQRAVVGPPGSGLLARCRVRDARRGRGHGAGRALGDERRKRLPAPHGRGRRQPCVVQVDLPRGKT